MHASLLSISLNLALAAAWLPVRDKRVHDKNGRDIFRRITTTHDPSKSYDNYARYPGDTFASRRHLKYPRSLSNTSDHRIRGVNLGSLFVFEPWLAEDDWNNLGCNGAQSEFDCVMALGQDSANTAFQQHWSTFYSQDDFSQMTSLGLNTVRIPVGYWMYEDIVDSSSEHFPQGGLQYLQQVCGWASDAGMFIIIDLHGAPGAQVAQNADTGQFASTPGFYDSYNYERALKFLEWMTNQIHTNNEFRNVGVLEIVNEPIQDQSTAASMISSYYPQAFDRIRAAETALSVPSSNYLSVQMLNELWGSGDPTSSLSSEQLQSAAYDDHRYIKWAGGQTQTKDAYMTTSCHDNRGSDNENPTIVGEFSLSAPSDDSQQWDSDWNPSSNAAWYLGWFSAQARSYEQVDGWIFWTWKAFLGDPRWSYTDAVTAGLIPQNLDDIYSNTACDGF